MRQSPALCGPAAAQVCRMAVNQGGEHDWRRNAKDHSSWSGIISVPARPSRLRPPKQRSAPTSGRLGPFLRGSPRSQHTGALFPDGFVRAGKQFRSSACDAGGLCSRTALPHCEFPANHKRAMSPIGRCGRQMPIAFAMIAAGIGFHDARIRSLTVLGCTARSRDGTFLRPSSNRSNPVGSLDLDQAENQSAPKCLWHDKSRGMSRGRR